MTTKKLGLYQPTINDIVDDTMVKLSDNFQKIDDKFDEISDDVEDILVGGTTYPVGMKVWNQNPMPNEYVGWVNCQTGVFGKKWKSNTKYIVGDFVIPNANNGHVYQCVAEGTSYNIEPSFPTVANTEVQDIKTIQTWQMNTPVVVGDIVSKTNHDTTYYAECIVAGTTDILEPTWIDIEGVTQVDGSVTWYIYKTVKWKEVGTSSNFRPFGKVE